jgi:hypothetical protein
MRAIVKMQHKVTMQHFPETGVGGTGTCYIGDLDEDGVLWNPKLHTLSPKDNGRVGLQVLTGTVVILLEDKKGK